MSISIRESGYKVDRHLLTFQDVMDELYRVSEFMTGRVRWRGQFTRAVCVRRKISCP